MGLCMGFHLALTLGDLILGGVAWGGGRRPVAHPFPDLPWKPRLKDQWRTGVCATAFNMFAITGKRKKC